VDSRVQLLGRFAVIACILGAGWLSGCAAQPSPLPGPSADQWAGSVCETLGPWRTRITALNAQAQTQVGAATTPAETKEKLLALLEGARSATEETRSALAAVGAPAVDGGAEIAARFVESLEGARDAYGRAGVAVRELSTANEATFYDGLGVIFKNLNDEYARAGVDTAGLNSPALREAFGRAPACR
jgi:hypothetical protein